VLFTKVDARSGVAWAFAEGLLSEEEVGQELLRSLQEMVSFYREG
jgi:hypothetical protein